jgi:hypothetical protein
MLVLLALLLTTSASARDLPYGQAAGNVTATHEKRTEQTEKTKVERHFDEKGQLDIVTFYDYSVDPPRIERLTIQAGTRVRTTERGQLLLRREVEHYGKTGQLRLREIEDCVNEGCEKLDHKTMFEYASAKEGSKVTISEYLLVEDRWKLKGSSEQPSL